MTAINRCSALKCINTSKNSIVSFFRFPKDIKRARMWVMACGRNDIIEKLEYLHNTSYRLCGMHFDDNMFANKAHNRLRREAVPSIFTALEGSSSSSVREPVVFDEPYQDELICFKVEEDAETILKKEESMDDLPISFPMEENVETIVKKEESMDFLSTTTMEENAETIAKKEESIVFLPLSLPVEENSETIVEEDELMVFSHKQTQTSQKLSANSPRKLKLRKTIRKMYNENFHLKQKVKRLEEKDSTASSLENITLDDFKRLTDKFCSKDVAKRVNQDVKQSKKKS